MYSGTSHVMMLCTLNAVCILCSIFLFLIAMIHRVSNTLINHILGGINFNHKYVVHASVWISHVITRIHHILKLDHNVSLLRNYTKCIYLSSTIEKRQVSKERFGIINILKFEEQLGSGNLNMICFRN